VHFTTDAAGCSPRAQPIPTPRPSPKRVRAWHGSTPAPRSSPANGAPSPSTPAACSSSPPPARCRSSSPIHAASPAGAARVPGALFLTRHCWPLSAIPRSASRASPAAPGTPTRDDIASRAACRRLMAKRTYRRVGVLRGWRNCRDWIAQNFVSGIRGVPRVPCSFGRRSVNWPAVGLVMPTRAAGVACPVPGCAVWPPHKQRRKARPGRAAARARVVAISTMSGQPQPWAGQGQLS